MPAYRNCTVTIGKRCDKKVVVTDKRFDSDLNNIKQEELLEIMKYHLAVHILRNQINHASETELEPDILDAAEKLKEEFGIDATQVEFNNIKNLLQDAIIAVRKIEKKNNNRGVSEESFAKLVEQRGASSK